MQAHCSSLKVLQASCCAQKTRLSGGLSRMVCQATVCSTLQKRAPLVVVPPVPTQHPQNTGFRGVMLPTLPVLHQAPFLILKVTSCCCCNMRLVQRKATSTMMSSSNGRPAVAAAICVVYMHSVCQSGAKRTDACMYECQTLVLTKRELRSTDGPTCLLSARVPLVPFAWCCSQAAPWNPHH